MDYPVWECEDGADVGEVCTGWDMTNAGLIWEWEWGGGADVGEDYKGWDMTGFGLVWEWGDELCVCLVGEDGRGGQGERDAMVGRQLSLLLYFYHYLSTCRLYTSDSNEILISLIKGTKWNKQTVTKICKGKETQKMQSVILSMLAYKKDTKSNII
jgi:hypothetical protein